MKTWKLNVAHNFFIQDKPHLYKEAIKYYEPIVKKNSESVRPAAFRPTCTHIQIDPQHYGNRPCKLVCGLHYDQPERGCRGSNEEDRKRRGESWISGINIWS